MTSFIMNVAFDCTDPRSLARFWAAVTGYSVAFESDDVVRLKAPDSRGVKGMIFWRVPEPKTAKTRVHVDLACKNPQEEVSRLLSLGAEILQLLPDWTVMADPEGNEFCLG